MAKTVEQIIGYAQDILKIDNDVISIPGLAETRAITWVDDLNEKFFDEFYAVGMVAPDYMRREKGYDLVTNTDLDGAIVAGTSTISLTDASNFDTSGAGVIWGTNSWDIFTYTGKSSNDLTGVSGVDFAHADETRVEKLYALPSDFGRLRPGRDRGHGVIISNVPYYEVPENPTVREFSIYDDGSSKYLWLPSGVTSGDAMVLYDKVSTTLDELSDTVDVPSPYHWYIVWGLVALFRQVQEEDYVPQKEENEMQKVLRKAFMKRNSGKRIKAGSSYFKRRTTIV